MRSIPVRWSLLGVVLIAIVAYGGTGLVRAVRASDAGHDHTVFSAQQPNVPGKTLTAIVVEYGPGGSSPAHRHVDGTEEQNLGERGNPAARIKKNEVTAAFGKRRKK